MDKSDDLLEQAPFVEKTPVPTPSRELPREPQVKYRPSPFVWVAMSFSLVALVISCYTLVTLFQEPELPPEPPILDEPEKEVISFQGLEIPIETDVPVNPYNKLDFYFDEDDYICYDVDGTTAIPGIDVSIYQQDIDWEQVAEAGFKFAMIRVGYRGYGAEGNLMMDENYIVNLQGAREAGLEVGVYFFSQALNFREVDEEIAMLKNLIQNYEITYPVVFDWEFISNNNSARTTHMTGDDLTELALRFCEEFEAAGYTPAVYFNQDLAYKYLTLSKLKDYSFWLAQYNTRPTFYYDFDMWQYSQSGTVPGIEGPVDLNLSFRDYTAE